MTTEKKKNQAVKQYEGPSFTNWLYGKYRVTTYPDSERVLIVLANNTSKRVVGRKIEPAVRAAIAKAEGRA